MFEKIKGYYETGLWSLERVRNVVGKAINEQEFREITGEEYLVSAPAFDDMFL